MTSSEKKRKEHNNRVLNRAFDAEDDLRTCDIVDTNFPPRPMIKKDLRALAFIRSGNKKNEAERK